VRSLCSLFFKCKYKEIGTLYGDVFDIVACMDARKYLLLCYSLKISLVGALLNYGLDIVLKNETSSPPSGPIFNIT
jgi:hypothetical protein